MKRAAVVVAVIVWVMGHGRAQGQGDKADVIRLDPALDAIISTDAKLQLMKSGFGFTEGTNWVQNGKTGYLLFSDIPANVVYKMTPDGTVSVYLDRSGYTGPWNGFTMMTAGGGTVSGPFIMIGSDGLTLDREGRLIICAFGDRALVRIEKDGKRTVLADNYEGKGFNGPNDVIVKKDGAIYFSDTYSGLRFHQNDPSKGKELDPHRLPKMVILMIRDGKLKLVIDDLASTNGLALSPDERYLYANSANKIYRYDVLPDDTVSNRSLLIDLSVDKAPGGTDGMRVDSKGYIYSTGPGGVWIISPEGKHLGTILVPGINLTFGDADWKSVYIAARGDRDVAGTSSIYKIRVKTPGVPCHSCSP
jgi:gluconolactonase